MVCMTHKHESSQASLTLQLEVYLIFPASFPFSSSTILASPSSPALSLALWHGGAHDLSNKEKKKQKTNTFEKNHSYTAIQGIDSDATEEMSYYGAAGQCVCRRWKSEQRGECLEALQRKLTSSWLWFFLFLFLSPFLWV